MSPQNTIAEPCPCPCNATQGLVTNCPRTCASLLFFSRVSAPGLELCCLISTVYPALPNPEVPSPPGLHPAPIHKALSDLYRRDPTAGALLQKQSYQTMTPTPVDDAPSFSWSHEPVKAVKIIFKPPSVSQTPMQCKIVKRV